MARRKSIEQPITEEPETEEITTTEQPITEEIKTEEVSIEPTPTPEETTSEPKTEEITTDQIRERNPDIANNPAPIPPVKQPTSIRSIEVLSDQETQYIIENRLKSILKLDVRGQKLSAPALVKYRPNESQPPIEALVEIESTLFKAGYDYYMANAPNPTAKGYMDIIYKLLNGGIRKYRVVVSFNLL